jgi:hypothetical protein
MQEPNRTECLAFEFPGQRTDSSKRLQIKPASTDIVAKIKAGKEYAEERVIAVGTLARNLFLHRAPVTIEQHPPTFFSMLVLP